MKKIVLLAVMVAVFLSVNAQNNDSTKINYKYCEIIGQKPFGASNMRIIIDYGNNSEPESVNYKSMVETLNTLVLNGWELVQAYTAPTNNGNNMYYRWILKCKIKK